jgi:hypothetical protein
MYNKLVPLELDSNPILSRTDAELSRNVSNETDSLGAWFVGGPDLIGVFTRDFSFAPPDI